LKFIRRLSFFSQLVDAGSANVASTSNWGRSFGRLGIRGEARLLSAQAVLEDLFCPDLGGREAGRLSIKVAEGEAGMIGDAETVGREGTAKSVLYLLFLTSVS
jgi:hypothetical protein